MSKPGQLPAKTEFLLYQTEDGRIRIETRLENENIWLNLNQIAELFGLDKSGISRHLKNIFETGELHQRQLLQKLQQLPLMKKSIRLSTSILTLSYQLVTG